MKHSLSRRMKSRTPYFKTVKCEFSFTEQQQQKSKKTNKQTKLKRIEFLLFQRVNPRPTKVYFTTYLTKGGYYDPLWKFVIKHPTFMKVVANLSSNDPVFTTVLIQRLFFSKLECKIPFFAGSSCISTFFVNFQLKMANSHSS